MADENDPNKPEDDLPETRPTGETEATPVEQPRDEALFTAEPEPPVAEAEPEPPEEPEDVPERVGLP